MLTISRCTSRPSVLLLCEDLIMAMRKIQNRAGLALGKRSRRGVTAAEVQQRSTQVTFFTDELGETSNYFLLPLSAHEAFPVSETVTTLLPDRLPNVT